MRSHDASANTAGAAGSRRVIVYFDDECGFCTRCCRVLARADRARNLTFIGAREVARHCHNLSAFDLDRSIVAIDATSGHAAVRSRAAALILRVLPPPYCWLRWIGMGPFVGISDRVYDLVARHRRHLSRALGESECVVPSGTGLPPAAPETQKPRA